MNYFAYGSNMDKERMTERGIHFTSRSFAQLVNYKLVFNKKATCHQNCAYANIIESVNSIVEGVLYTFQDTEIELLDYVEGYPEHYIGLEVMVKDKNGTAIHAITYKACEEKLVEGAYPKKSYLKYLLEGRDLLSETYYKQLCETKTCDE